MNRLLAKLALAANLVSQLCGGPATAQLLPPAEKAAHVEIIKGTELEFARDDWRLSVDKRQSRRR